MDVGQSEVIGSLAFRRNIWEVDVAQGRPTKWATATITEPVPLGKAGIKIVVWDKWGKKRRGTAIISVGGIRWYPYKTKKYTRISWYKLSMLDGR